MKRKLSANIFTKMSFHKNIWLLIFLCVCMNIAQSSNLNKYQSSETDVQFGTIKDENMRQIMPSIRKYEKAVNQIKVVKRQVPLVVNEDFELLPYLNESNSEINVDEEDDGSGTDAFDEHEASVTELYNNTLDYEYQQKTSSAKTSTQSMTNATEQVLKTTVQSSTMFDLDGSGDDIIQVTTETPDSRSTPPGHIGQETIPDICINSTCDANELFVSLSEESNIIAEGTNFTFSCNSNYSDHTLHWYKSNGSVYFLQAFGSEKQLHLTLTDTKSIHSGKYICVHWVSQENCCSLQSDLKVYEVPLYKYHIIILGLIVAACLIICIVLSVRQSKTMKSYTKHFMKRHGSVKTQLL